MVSSFRNLLKAATGICPETPGVIFYTRSQEVPMTAITHVKPRTLGNSKLSVFPIGLGCMSFSGAYGKSDDAEAIRVIHHALDRGVNFLDSSETIRRAHKVHPLAAVQSEYSLLYRVDAEETLKTTRALGISFVAYSPLGRSLLTGAVRQVSDIPEGDGRGRHPRFAAANLARNLAQVAAIETVAREKGFKPGQVALAWLLAQGPDIVPIPGTKRAERIDENLAALDVVLSADDVARISAALPPGAAAGPRYPEAG